MQVRPNISYAVCVKDEVESFKCLINFLNIHKKQDDENSSNFRFYTFGRNK